MKTYFPSLNGLRALSVILVILYHFKIYFLYVRNTDIGENWSLFFDGALGVNIFFIISGFLITSLMMEEEKETRNVSLRNFYIRRTLRIFPAYYFMLAVYFILQLANVIDISGASWLTSITYTKYFNHDLDVYTAHAWSLSIEEHFYLLWPFVFKYAKASRTKVALALVLLVPILRLAAYEYNLTWMNAQTIFQRGDALMWGCVFALYHRQIVFYIRKYIARYNWLVVVPFLLIPACYYINVLNRVYGLHLGLLTISVGGTTGTIACLAVGVIMIISMQYRNNAWFRFLNHPVCNYLGKLSYSLYLWQQLFTISGITAITTPPLNLLYILVAANLSYYFIEKPFLTLKKRFETPKKQAVVVPHHTDVKTVAVGSSVV